MPIIPIIEKEKLNFNYMLNLTGYLTSNQKYSYLSLSHRVRYRGGRGAMAPPNFKLGGASNVFGPPPQFLGKIQLCTQLMYSVFL